MTPRRSVLADVRRSAGECTGRSARRAITIAEAAISSMIVGVMLVAALNAAGDMKMAEQKARDRAQGGMLAQQLMAEILDQAYIDPDVAVALPSEDTLDPIFLDGNGAEMASNPVGPENDEATDTRADFDDVDDYHNWSASPPVGRDGTEISSAKDCARSVSVQWIEPVNEGQSFSDDPGAKLVTVHVNCFGREVSALTAIRTAAGVREMMDRPGE